MSTIPWQSGCPIDVQKFLNLAASLEGYLKPRAKTEAQKAVVGQLSAIRRYMPAFSDQPIIGNRRLPSKAVRQQVLARDHHTCQHCGSTDPTQLTIHHIIPRNLGGNNTPANLLTLCATCHQTLHTAP